MGTEIKTWQITDGKLTSVDTALKNEGRTEPYDLEPWLASNPEIIGTDTMIIGRQVMTKSGPIDLLGIDKSGNTEIIEIKRDELPREALAQAIDYASNVAEWTAEKLSEIHSSYNSKAFGLLRSQYQCYSSQLCQDKRRRRTADEDFGYIRRGGTGAKWKAKKI